MVKPCKSQWHRNTAIFTTLALIFFLNISSALAQLDGKKIYKANCRSCHYLDDKSSTGPGFQGLSGKHPDKEWTFKWVKNNVSFAKTDSKAAEISKLTTNTMTVFEGVLTDDEIKAVIDYLYTNPTEEKKVDVAKGGSGATTSEQEGGINPLYLVLVVITVMLIIISALRSVKRNLQNTYNEKHGLPPLEELNWRQWCSRNKRTVALIVIVTTSYGLQAGWYALKDIGVYTGYKPEQPIKFSHKIHAGENGISCEYCHSGVLKSKVAGVPSANVCMNCHKGIEQGPTTGTDEIAKIYAATGFDAATKTYTKTPQPLKWNKVHVLPDFVYFNHQQHVVVGKQECKTCHGDLTQMDVAEQVSPLTMGWCIDCHRKTEVPGMKDNPYYEDLHKKLAEKYSGQKDSIITVARMGGIECAKCHY
jgi:mono/diheme cytochrome c family protein